MRINLSNKEVYSSFVSCERIGVLDYQPEELLDELVKKNHVLQLNYTNVIPLMSSGEKLKCLKGPSNIEQGTFTQKSNVIPCCSCFSHFEMKVNSI